MNVFSKTNCYSVKEILFALGEHIVGLSFIFISRASINRLKIVIFFQIYFFIIVLSLGDILYSLGWSRTHYVDKAILEFVDILDYYLVKQVHFFIYRDKMDV